jgi:hypothetical protein
MKTPKPLRFTKTFSITVPRELLPLIKRRAQESGRSVSSYLSWLVAKDWRKKP